MSKRIVEGVGMMQRTTTKYQMDDSRDREDCIAAWTRFSEQMPVAEPDDLPGDALLRHNAERCRAILATVGLADLMDGKGAVNLGPLRERGLDEDSSQWIAAHWLGAFNFLMNSRQKLLQDNSRQESIGHVIEFAQELGRLQERMWWRAGIDPQTGRRRESLALTGRSVKKGQTIAGEQTSKRHEPTRKARFKRMKELVAKIGVEKAARQCEAEGLGGWQGIKKQWDRHKKRDT